MCGYVIQLDILIPCPVFYHYFGTDWIGRNEYGVEGTSNDVTGLTAILLLDRLIIIVRIIPSVPSF